MRIVNSAAFLLFALGCLGVGGCSLGDTPFAKRADPWAAASRRAPVVAVAAAGAPQEELALLLAALRGEAARRDVAIAAAPGPEEAYRLDGEIVAQAAGAGTLVRFSWTFRDRRAGEPQRIEGEEYVARPAEGGPWAVVDAGVLRRIAQRTAEALSGHLGQLGHSTLSAGLPPPTDGLLRAGAGAEKELDPDLMGTGSLGAPPAAPPVAAVAEPARPAQSAPAPANAPERRARTVTVASVKGAAGSGNAELAQAMRRVLAAAGWTIAAKSKGADLAVEGEVSLAAAEGGSQNVALAWRVRDAEGALIGTIRQANSVPAGTLDRGWGNNAEFAAQAAAAGIFDLIEKQL